MVSFAQVLWNLLFLIVFHTNLDNPKEFGCNAQSQNPRFLINFASDFSEIFLRLPKSNLAGAVSPIIKSAQNNLIANRPVPLSRRPGRVLLSNDRKRIRFFVFRDRRTPSFELDLDRPAYIPSFRVAADSQVKIIIHGLNSNAMGRFPVETRDAYLQATNNPVIVVDWNELSSPAVAKPIRQILYPSAADNVVRAGQRVSELILFLLENRIITDLQQVHIVGFSLGAHVAGHAGKIIQQRLGRKINRITGLDPAAPLFISVADDRKLSRDDADFVDVYHTSLAGLFAQIGNVDFYPNGGKVQPRCLRKGMREQNFFSCNHGSAPLYFARSILERNLPPACGCNSYQEFRAFCGNTCSIRSTFGEYVSHRTRGRFFLDLP